MMNHRVFIELLLAFSCPSLSSVTVQAEDLLRCFLDLCLAVFFRFSSKEVFLA